MKTVVLSTPDCVLSVLSAALGAFRGTARVAWRGPQGVRLTIADEGAIDISPHPCGAAVQVQGSAGLSRRVQRILRQHYMFAPATAHCCA